MNGQVFLDHLLQSKDNRADCFDIHDEPFQIGVYKHEEYLFLVATAYKKW